MQPFKSFKSMGLPIDIANCDTDAIIPARFLRIPLDDPGYDKYLEYTFGETMRAFGESWPVLQQQIIDNKVEIKESIILSL